jgi:tetratricopeptide (TPR) repeat protein
MIAGQAADEATLHEAEEHFYNALKAVEKGRQPQLYAMLHSNLGELMLAYTSINTHSRYDLLQNAMSHFGEALPLFPQDHHPLQYARILFGQGRALAMMGQKDAARQLYQEAYELRNHLPDHGRQIEKALADLS